MRLRKSKEEVLKEINGIYIDVNVSIPSFAYTAPNSVADQLISAIKYAVQDGVNKGVTRSMEVLLNNCYTDEDFNKELEKELSQPAK